MQREKEEKIFSLRSNISTSPAGGGGLSLQRYFSVLEPSRVILEAGTHSAWVRRWLESLGHEVITANPAKLQAITSSQQKTDERDARCLAQLGRVDPACCRRSMCAVK